MRFPSSVMISEDWVRENCKCVNNEGRLLCQESCPIHNTAVEVPKAVRTAITKATAELGWKLDWFTEEKQ